MSGYILNITGCSINSTDFALAANKKTMCDAIIKATEQGADFLIFSPMPFTGPSADANYAFINSQSNGKVIIDSLSSMIAEFPPSDLVSFISFPWYHRDAQQQDVTHPFYLDNNEHTENRPFYATAIVQHGQIIGLQLASDLAYIEGVSYDARYFKAWPLGKKETVTLNGREIPVGHFPIYINDKKDANQTLTVVTESYQSMSVKPEAALENSYAQSLRQQGVPVSALFTANATALSPATVQHFMQQVASDETTVAFVSDVGSDSGDRVGSGQQFVVQGQRLLSQSNPDALYTHASFVNHAHKVSVPFANKSQQSVAGLQIDMNIADKKSITPQAAVSLLTESQDQKDLKAMNATVLWLRDYLLKTKQQGFVISMSDGINSIYSLKVASLSIDYALAQHEKTAGTKKAAVAAYLKEFAHLSCAKRAREMNASENAHEGPEAAIRYIKQQLLTCVYMPCRTSSVEEERRMIHAVEEFGGTYYHRTIQGILDANLHSASQSLGKDAVAILAQDQDEMTAAKERARVTLAGIYGNLGNKISLSNADATDVARGRLNAGGKGQEGPISATLCLNKTRIAKLAGRELALEDKLRYEKEELITEVMIHGKKSPAETVQILKDNPLWASETAVLAEVDNACLLWSKSQVKRVALAIAPNLGYLGNSVDRYGAVRTTRNSQYFHNGRVELKAAYFHQLFNIIHCDQTRFIDCALRDKGLKRFFRDTSIEELKSKKTEFDALWQNFLQAERHTPAKTNPMQADTKPALPDANTRHFNLKIASANVHQKMFDYENNIRNIKEAINKANQDGADILSLQELGLTGYFGDGDFDWVNNKEEGDKIFRHALEIARYAHKINPNLIISLGFPVFHEGIYRNLKRPFNGQALIQDGKIKSISLKSIQPDGPAEFEAMHFTPYREQDGVKSIRIPGQEDTISVGKPLVTVTDKKGNQVALLHEQCAEGWPGVYDNQTVNADIQKQKRHINRLNSDPSLPLVILNPSGSKTQVNINKPAVRKKLVHSAFNTISNLIAYCYTNVAGVEDGYMVADSGSIYRGKDQNGQFIDHQSPRFHHERCSYSSMVVAAPKSSKPHPSALSMTVDQFNSTQSAVGTKVNGPSDVDLLDQKSPGYEKIREYTETTYATAIWILDTLREHQAQSLIISLSGGADSSYGAVSITHAIDTFIAEHSRRLKPSISNENSRKLAAIATFFDEYPHLEYRDEILAIHNAEKAIRALKDKVLVCAYMPTENSSEDTLLSAQALIEGGPQYKLDEQGSIVRDSAGNRIIEGHLEGTGGRFMVNDLQAPLEEYLLAYSGIKEDLILQGSLESAEDTNIDAFIAKQIPLLQQQGITDDRILKVAALENFFKKYPYLEYRDEILALSKQRVDVAIGVLKNNLALIERCKQHLLDYARGAMRKKDLAQLNPENKDQLIALFKDGIKKENLPKELRKVIQELPPTWQEAVTNKAVDLALQNVQPRLRSIFPWLLAKHVKGYPFFTSNLSEAVAGYSTWAGDTSLGYENILGGVLKSDIREILKHYEKGELCGSKPIDGLFYVNKLEPSAELRPLLDGKYTQTDEADLMPYTHLDKILYVMLLRKNTPLQVFNMLKDAKDKNGDRLWSCDEELIDRINKVCWLYTASQFKRTGGGATPYTGQNVDSHMAERTKLFSNIFNVFRIEMKLQYLLQQSITEAGGDKTKGEAWFARRYGKSYEALKVAAYTDIELGGKIASCAAINDLPSLIQTKAYAAMLSKHTSSSTIKCLMNSAVFGGNVVNPDVNPTHQVVLKQTITV